MRRIRGRCEKVMVPVSLQSKLQSETNSLIASSNFFSTEILLVGLLGLPDKEQVAYQRLETILLPTFRDLCALFRKWCFARTIIS